MRTNARMARPGAWNDAIWITFDLDHIRSGSRPPNAECPDHIKGTPGVLRRGVLHYLAVRP